MKKTKTEQLWQDAGTKKLSNENDSQKEKNLNDEPDKISKEEKSAEFEKLIRGEFKEQFEQRIAEIIKRRFKENSETDNKNSQNDKIVNMLMTRYGIKDYDIKSLFDAIEKDDGYIKDEAVKKGIDPETLKKLKNLEFENMSMKKELENERNSLKMENTLKSWMADGEGLLKKYPDFNLEAESQNPKFLNLLRAGVDLKDAYNAVHHDEIVEKMVEKAVEDAIERTAQSIKSRGMRPLENGMSQKSTALFKTDVSRLTPEQRAEIARRVSGGEIISF